MSRLPFAGPAAVRDQTLASSRRRKMMLLAFVSLAPTCALAQTPGAGASPPAANAGTVEEVVVTAERRETSLQTTPIAVSAVTSATLANRDITSIDKIGASVPNFQVLPVTASPATIALNLRGAPDSSGAVLTDEGPVGFYVDDVFHPRLAGSNFQFSDIERIEVLRGPQGTLYGRNTLAGAVKIVTRRPGNSEWLNAEIGGGSYGSLMARASVGGPLVRDMVGLSAAIVTNSTDGYIYNRALGKELGGAQSTAGHVNLTVFGIPNFDGFFSAYASVDRNTGTTEIPVQWPLVTQKKAEQATFVAGGPYITQSPNEGLGRNKQYGATMNLAYSWPAVQLRSITGYGHVRDRFKLDFSGGTEKAPGVYTAGFTRDGQASSRSISEELQLLSRDTGAKLSWVTGLYFFDERGHQVFYDQLTPTISLLPANFSLQTKSIAAYGQATYQFTDALSFTAGVRYTHDKKTGFVTIQNGFAFPFTLASLNLHAKFKAFTPHFSLDYKFSDVTFAYVSVSKGFQGGGFNSLAVADPKVVAVPYDNETVWSYEAGVKTEFFDRRLRLNTAIFDAVYTGLQQTAQISTATNSFAIQNVGKATVYGLELEAVAQITRDLKAFANVGLMDNKYNRLIPGSTAYIAHAEHIQSTPKVNYQLGFDYTQPIPVYGDELQLRLGADMSHKSRFYSDVPGSLETQPQTLVNGYVAIDAEGGRWEVKLSGKNLGDKHYIQGASATAQFGGIMIGAPRTYMLTLAYRY